LARLAIQHLIAEIEIDLAAARTMLACTATMADALFRQHPAGSAPLGELHELMKDFQASWVATEATGHSSSRS